MSIPRELERAATSVLIEELDGGELRITPTVQVRERIREVGRRAVAERADAFKIPAEHDSDDDSVTR